VRTEALPSRIRGSSLGRMSAGETGMDWLTGWEARIEVSCASASRRWVSVFEVLARERACVNWVVVEGAAEVRDCWFMTIAGAC
jgi:hypothetical protein